MSTPLNEALGASPATRRPNRSGAPHTRLRGRRLILARVVWVTVVSLIVALFLARLPAYATALQTVCTGAACGSAQPTLDNAQALQKLGLSVGAYAAFTLALTLALAFLCFAVGAVIFWRRSDDWLALLAAFFLVMSYTTSSSNPPTALALAYPALTLPLSIFGCLGQASIGVFFLLFPNGRLMPHWMGLILLLVIINAFLNNFPSLTSSFETNWPAWLYGLVTGVIFLALIYSQIYRYRRSGLSLE